MHRAEIAHLLKLEWQLDRRQKHAWGSMALYVVSTIYVCYLGVRHLFDIPVWNALFWIILLFAAFNALARSFQRENAGRQLYLYTLASPRSVVLARTLYNGATMAVLSLLSLLVYTLLLGTDVLVEAETQSVLRGRFLRSTLRVWERTFGISARHVSIGHRPLARRPRRKRL